MKKTFIAVAMGLFVLTGSVAFAQSGQAALPSAGLTPESSFYFLEDCE
ncbi:hypothetical protein HY838_01065 [Candidatus Azambacteria bacterium]|nr:hypothetical protein [Candidatus Azambacteria bacterium]